MNVDFRGGAHWSFSHQENGRSSSEILADEKQRQSFEIGSKATSAEPKQSSSDNRQASTPPGVTVSISPESRQASAEAQAKPAEGDNTQGDKKPDSPYLSHPLLRSSFTSAMGLDSGGVFGSSGKSADRDKDIEASNLPPEIQASLKRIRDMKEQIEEKKKELQEVMNDPSLPDEVRSEKIKQLSGEIARLNTAIQSAKESMGEFMKSQGLSSEDQMKAMNLAM